MKTGKYKIRHFLFSAILRNVFFRGPGIFFVFNLVEIVLAIAILSVGATSILSLFPLGMQETRDAIGHNYSSEAAQNMFAYIAKEAYNDWSILNSIPEVADKPVSKYTNSNWSYNIATNIWDDELPDTDSIYGLKISSGDSIDFSGEVLIWKSQLENIPEFGDVASYNDAAALHMEISWPVEKPYSQRQKNYYYLELYNHN